MDGEKVKTFFFAYGYPVILTPFMEKITFPSLKYLGIFCKTQLTYVRNAQFFDTSLCEDI